MTFVLLLVCGSTSAVLHAQEQSFRFEHVLIPGSSNENIVTSIAQDSLGFMWFGTWGGLHRYDGYSFTTYTYDATDSTSLSANWIECLYVDRAGTLWAGTYGGGLNRFNPATESFTRYARDPKDPTSLSHDSVTVVLEDDTGALWVGTMGGLNRLDRATETFTRYQYDEDDPSTLGNDQVRALLEDSEGTLWVGTNSPWAGERDNPGPGGLNRFDRESGAFTRYLHHPEDPQSLISNHVMSLFEDARGTLWVGTMGNVLHAMNRKAGTFERYVYDPARPGALRPSGRSALSASCHANSCGGIIFIDEDREGTLWVGALFQGVLRFEPETKAVIHFAYESDNPASLSSNFIWSTVESRDGTRWITTLGTGVEKARAVGSRFAHYALAPALGSNWLTALHVSPFGSVWVGTTDRLATFVRRGSSVASYEVLSTVAWAEATPGAMKHSRNGTLWIGTYEGTPASPLGGLYRMDSATGSVTQVLGEIRAASEAVRRMHLPKLYMALGLARLRDHTLELVGAGMPPALIYRAVSKCIEEVALSGLPLGSPGEFPYSKHCITLSAGDTLVLMSDGLPELRDGSGQMLGYESMSALVAEAAVRKPEEIITHLLQAAKTWGKGQAPGDDMTFIAMKVKA